ncbi:hypothetical protein HYT18_04410 [Candidatus Microgenomates bacterium]|nr:hypothetical protein [Candidatus Microgenomates bacterium]
MRGTLGSIRIAILAVGSSTKSEELREHPVRDIDLLILNSDPHGSDVRYGVGRQIKGLIRKFLESRFYFT